MANLLNAKELKERASIADLLSRLGYKPVPRQGRELMYISMLRNNDTKPSLSVNDDLGVWFDHGLRKGGNIIDFGLAFWNTLTFAEVVEKIQQVLALENEAPRLQRPRKAIRLPHYIIQQVKEIGTTPAITGYLKSRGVFEAARGILNEVHYYVENDAGHRKQFFAAGWQNSNMGWEVRNKYFKGCLGHKAISFIKGHEKQAAVFEGFLDYLSWKIENPEATHSIIVLNSISFLPEGINKAKWFSSIDLFFDRDLPGVTATKELIAALPYATDRSSAYAGYNDYNDKLKARIGAAKPAAGYLSGLKVPFSR